MKTKTALLTVIALFLLMVGTGCKEDLSYYSGTIVALDGNNGCFDIIRIDKSPQGGLASETAIAFDANLLSNSLKLNDVVKFEIISYEKLIDPESTLCLHPTYSAIVILLKN